MTTATRTLSITFSGGGGEWGGTWLLNHEADFSDVFGKFTVRAADTLHILVFCVSNFISKTCSAVVEDVLALME